MISNVDGYSNDQIISNIVTSKDGLTDVNVTLPLMSSIDWSTKPGLPFTFNFEMIDDIDDRIVSLGSNINLWIMLSILYVVTIFTLQYLMKSRPPYTLRIPLILWNLGLTIFSAASVIRIGSDLVTTLTGKGIFATFCDASSFNDDPRVKVWIWLFSLSKLVEFGDTIFIVLRKQKLIFLHWFHHAITLLYTTSSIGFYLPAYSRWFMTINAFIHTIMYGYYAARAAKFKFPKIVNMSITSLQIIQMVAGLFINGTTLYHQTSSQSTLILSPSTLSKSKVKHCDGHPNASIFGLSIYLTFLILFSQFFVSSYIKPESGKPKSLSDKENNNISYKNGFKKLN